MGKEKRKFLRFECLLPVELIRVDGRDHINRKVEARDFSREGLKLSINFDLEMGSDMARVTVDEVPPEFEDAVEQAADECPVEAIVIE